MASHALLPLSSHVPDYVVCPAGRLAGILSQGACVSIQGIWSHHQVGKDTVYFNSFEKVCLKRFQPADWASYTDSIPILHATPQPPAPPYLCLFDNTRILGFWSFYRIPYPSLSNPICRIPFLFSYWFHLRMVFCLLLCPRRTHCPSVNSYF